MYMLFATNTRQRAGQVAVSTVTVKIRLPSSPVQSETTLANVPVAFQPAMTDADHATLMAAMRRFSEAAKASNITFFMYWGTLIGSYRHHGRIPWDDDIDIMVPTKQKAQLETMLKSLAPDYLYAKSKYIRWKVFANNSQILRVSWKYPFIDVSFYLEDDTRLWDEDPGYKPTNTYRKLDVFPLVRRPFSGLMLPAPSNTLAVLKQFQLDKCVTSYYKHSVEEIIPAAQRMSIPCKELWESVPFVFRTNTGHGTNETLKIGSQVISWFIP